MLYLSVCCLSVNVSKIFSGLFTKAALPEFVAPSILDSSKVLIVEATIDAVVRLGQFIGDKQYSADVYDCTCHPI